jgi:catechol 2,3-dioxygenase-like lactoylglutathione lyase family enzyme
VAEQAIPVLRVADVSNSLTWYARLGFAEEWRHQFGDGYPWFVSILRGDVRLFLSEHEGDAPPDTLVHLRIDELDLVADELGERVRDQPWGRELAVKDPDGNRFRIGDA